MDEERDDLDKYTLELVYLMLEDWQGLRSDKFCKMGITERGIPVKSDDQLSKNRRLYTKKMDQRLVSA
jgi:hypothetical protein